MKIGEITYDGKSSKSFGLIVAGSGTFDPAEADMTYYTVPGRDGDIALYNNRHKNVTVTYPAFLPKGFESKAQDIRRWLTGGYASDNTYKKLSDNFDTSHFRMAIPKGMKFVPVNQNDAANMQLIFECKPQRFLTVGETATTYSSGSTITNPTAYGKYPAKPLVKLTNPVNGCTIKIASKTMTCLSSYTGSVTIDCETKNIYAYNGASLNHLFTGDFFELGSTSAITLTSISQITITPRWWEL